MRLLHAVAFRRKCMRWFTQTKVTTLKTQLHAVNACVKRSSQRSFSNLISFSAMMMLIEGYQGFFRIISNFILVIEYELV